MWAAWEITDEWRVSANCWSIGAGQNLDCFLADVWRQLLTVKFKQEILMLYTIQAQTKCP